jgi:hypothetical protein
VSSAAELGSFGLLLGVSVTNTTGASKDTKFAPTSTVYSTYYHF